MPLAGVSDAAKDYHAKKAAAEQGGIGYFKLDDGEEAEVRFLEEGDDFVTYYSHAVQVAGQRYPRQVPCPDRRPRPAGDKPCTGCEDGIKRSFKFAINLIWKNSPVLLRDEKNKLVKDASNKPKVKTVDGEIVREDRVVVWNGGISVAEDLDHLDGKFGGLTSRPFEIQRSGTGLDTKYRILPGGDKRPLTDSESKLAGEKFDLNRLRKAPDYDEFYSYQGATGGGNAGASAPSAEEASQSESPFRRRQQA